MSKENEPFHLQKLVPTAGRVVVRYVHKPKSTSAIIRPDQEDEIEPNIGVIVAVSERPSQSKVGCRILYNRSAGIPVNVDGEEFYLLNEDGILGFFVS